MATNRDVLQQMIGQTVPLGMSQIADKMGLKPNQINTILKRLCDKGFLVKDENNEYAITQEGVDEVNPPTLESENLTPMKIFEEFGRTIGINPTQLSLIANYVFSGGKYDDLTWVSKALGDMNVPADKLKAWWNNWRVYLHKEIPQDLADSLGASSTESVKKEKERVAEIKAGEKIEWDIGLDNLPVNVGEAAGRMTHAEAMEIAKYRELTKARVAALPQPPPAVEPLDPMAQLEKLMNFVKEHFSEGKAAKPLVVVPNEDGSFELQEFDPTKPLRVGGTAPAAPASHWVVEPDGNVRELKPGEPIVIRAPAQAGAQNRENGKSWVVHDADGSVEEYVPGKPIVIKSGSSRSEDGHTPMMINAQTPDGKPFVIDIESAFRWDDHMSKRRRDEESHEMKMDVAKGLKDLVTKGVKALDDMTPDEGGLP